MKDKKKNEGTCLLWIRVRGLGLLELHSWAGSGEGA